MEGHKLSEEEQKEGLKEARKGIKESDKLSKAQKENLLQGVNKAEECVNDE